ncbi:hypothetical protein EJ06DRAFT_533297 [Trichodelitschia bisporula]|uniref:Uncharacterized protein n=1 Tax=Trichodelitschia bisporula TaxID=703511 RepID=A0A6G1HMG8_9PEZI|nr:hypothetical protein EJ06DRAFT_533297 [Trichodelitschia bisporula]
MASIPPRNPRSRWARTSVFRSEEPPSYDEGYPDRPRGPLAPPRRARQPRAAETTTSGPSIVVPYHVSASPQNISLSAGRQVTSYPDFTVTYNPLTSRPPPRGSGLERGSNPDRASSTRAPTPGSGVYGHPHGCIWHDPTSPGFISSAHPPHVCPWHPFPSHACPPPLYPPHGCTCHELCSHSYPSHGRPSRTASSQARAPVDRSPSVVHPGIRTWLQARITAGWALDDNGGSSGVSRESTESELEGERGSRVRYRVVIYEYERVEISPGSTG